MAGKYRIPDQLVVGRMGVIDRAEDLTLKRRVALKSLQPHLADTPEVKERVLIEAQAAALRAVELDEDLAAAAGAGRV